jgi:hypothetical protein
VREFLHYGDKEKTKCKLYKSFQGKKMTHFEGGKNHTLLYLENRFFLIIGNREDFIFFNFIV